MCSGEQRGLLKEEEEISKHAQPTLGLEGTHSSFSLSLSLFFFFFLWRAKVIKLVQSPVSSLTSSLLSLPLPA